MLPQGLMLGRRQRLRWLLLRRQTETLICGVAWPALLRKDWGLFCSYLPLALDYCLELNQDLNYLSLDSLVDTVIDELKAGAPELLEIREGYAFFDQEIRLHRHPFEDEFEQGNTVFLLGEY